MVDKMTSKCTWYKHSVDNSDCNYGCKKRLDNCNVAMLDLLILMSIGARDGKIDRV